MDFPLDDVGEEQAVAALVAVIRGDDEEARRVLTEELTAAERETLVRHVCHLAALAGGATHSLSWRGVAQDGEALIVNVCELGVHTLLDIRRRLRLLGLTGGR